MKVFFKKIFLFSFLAILATSLTFIFIAFTPNLQPRTNIKSTTGGYGASLLRYREALTYGKVDLVFLGSSHCYRGFDPRLFSEAGISSFNLGSSSQSPVNSYYLLKDFSPYLQPKIIILELYWATLNSNGIESSIDIISNSNLSNNNFKMALKSSSISPSLTWLYQKFHRINYPLEKEILLPSKVDCYISGGYVETTRNTNASTIITRNNTILKDFTQLNYVDSIYNFCHSNNIDLFLVIAPVNKAITKSIYNYNNRIEEMEIFAYKRNLIFLDFNSTQLYESVNWDVKGDWYDNSHLTHSGVEKFNHYILENYQELLIGLKETKN